MRKHRWLIARQNQSLMIIAARNRALMTTCAVNCRSQVRQTSVYRVLSGDYGGGNTADWRDESPLGMITGVGWVITRGSD